MMMDFAGRLKRLRIEKGYSQATLAKKITDAGQKPGEASIAKYENGRIYPNLQTAACMADCFGVSSPFMPSLKPRTAEPKSLPILPSFLVPNTRTTISRTTSQCQMLNEPMISLLY